MLSNINKNRIILTGLYKHEPDKYRVYGSDMYHCRNWTFKPHEYNGEIYMVDTYFGDGNTYTLSDQNIDEFEFIFDFTSVKRIGDDETDEYEDNNVYRVATDSWGYSGTHLYWVDKEAKRSKEKLLNKQIDEINSLQRKLKWAEDELERIKDGTHYKLK